MYLLYPVTYPSRQVPGAAVESARRAARLEAAGAWPDPVDAAHVRAYVDAHLRAAGATPVHDQSGAWEVPDEALPTLERLEAFYHAVYPETVGVPSPGHFYYEQLEWLGQY